SRRRHTRSYGDWSSDVCSSDLPEQEGVADPALVDELLVQLADADAAGGVSGVLAGIGDRTAVDQGHLLAAGQGVQPIVNAVPARSEERRVGKGWGRRCARCADR